MTGFPIPQEDLLKVTPRDGARYLRTRGWREAGLARFCMRWTLSLGERDAAVLLPAFTDLTDYAGRMAELLQALANVEGRPVQAVHADMVLTEVDTQQISVSPDSPSGTITVAEGVAASRRISDLLLSAATTEVLNEPRLALPRNKPKRAKEFLAQALFGPSWPGSYVFSVRIPISDAGTNVRRAHQSWDVRTNMPPFPRRVSQRLYEAVLAAHDAAAEAADFGALDGFAERAPQGVSADLCEALAGLATSSRNGFSVSFAWSPLWPVPHSYTRPLARFPADYVPILEDASALLRGEDPRPATYSRARIIGPSVALRRPEQGEGGVITVLPRSASSQDLVARRINIRLSSAADYDEAARAHWQERDLVVEGDIVRRGNAYDMAQPESFAVAPEPPRVH
jgi:hypothetical protein